MSDENKIIDIQDYLDMSKDASIAVEKSFDITRDGEVSNARWSESIDTRMDNSTTKALFFSEDWVYIIVDLIANKISSQRLLIMKKQIDSDGNINIDIDETHPLNAVIDQPNPWQDYHAWMYNTSVEETLMGNAVVWWAIKNRHLITLAADLITLDIAKEGILRKYLLSSSNPDQAAAIGSAITAFDPKEIIHIRRPNPGSMLWGLSPFQPGRKVLMLNKNTHDYLNAFYLRQATPGLALVMDRHVNEDVALRQLRSFELAHHGRKNSRRTLILPKGVSVQTLTHDIAGNKLIETTMMNRETILNLLKVPKHEVGLQTAGSLGSEEYKIALRNFWEATLKPSMRRIEGALNKFFAKELGPDKYFEFDLSDIEALQDDVNKKAEIAEKMLAVLTTNEVREKIWNEKRLENPDADLTKPLLDKKAQPIGFNLSAIELQKPIIDNPIVNEETEEIEENKSMIFDPCQRIKDWHSKTQKQLDENQESKIGEIEMFVADILIKMIEKAVVVVAKELREKNYKPRSKKEAVIISKTEMRKRVKKAIDELKKEYRDGMTENLSATVDLGYDMQLELVLDDKHRASIEILKGEGADGRMAILKERGLDTFANVSETTTDRIMGVIEKGVEDKLSITNIARNIISEIGGEPSDVLGRASTIARTEVLTAVSIGQKEMIRHGVKVIGKKLKKIWLTANDSRVRGNSPGDKHNHVVMNNVVVDADSYFITKNGNKLMVPRDPSCVDPGEVIRCRCTSAVIVPEE